MLLINIYRLINSSRNTALEGWPGAWLGNSRTQHLLVCLLLVLIGVFYYATIRPGHNWGDDFALYIHHAENIASGHAYGDTGYIYNRSFPDYGPRTYPPVSPLLLAPVYYLYGMDLTAMKVEGVLLFLLTLLAVYAFFRDLLPFPYVLALIALFGLNPMFWEAKDNIGSDLPFLLFFYLSVNLVHYGRRDGPTWWRWAALTGLALYCCYGTRSVGLILLPGLALYDLLRWRRLTRFTFVAGIVCVALIFAQRSLIGAEESSYFEMFHPTAATLAYNSVWYAKFLLMLWYPGPSMLYARIVYGLTVGLALIGAYLRFRKGWTIIESFLVLYLMLILVWHANQGFRFLLPLVPLYLYYVHLGLLALTGRWKGWGPAAALGALLLIVGIDYVGTYREANFGVIPEANGRQSFNELCRFVRESTSPKDVFLIWRARAFSLFTDRPASVYHLTGASNDDAALWRYLAQIHADYIVTSNVFDDDRRFLNPFVERNRKELDLVFQDSEFRVYRIKRFGSEL